MFSSPILEKGFRYPSPILGIGSRFPSSVLETVLGSSPGKRFCVFPCPILGKGSIDSPVQYWGKVL